MADSPQHSGRSVVAPEPASPGPTSRLPHAAVWLIAVSLAFIACSQVLDLDAPVANPAFGQAVAHAGARGVFAFTGQVTKNTYGVFMVDVDAGTIWCYEWDEGRGSLRLLAARSWRYDRYLEEFNVGEPTPREVESLVEIERTRRLQEAGARED
ncbi:MAG: hypothetical protein GY842_23895 [bacterium]|nr:hypothetical protein [bacterium]